MAGELRSPRASADIDATAGHARRIEPDRGGTARRRPRIRSPPGRRGRPHPGRHDSSHPVRLPDRRRISEARGERARGPRVRRAGCGVRRDGARDHPFTVPALAEVELVAEKLRALVQRAQPRDLFDVRLYLVDSRWHLDPADLRTAVDAKFSITRHKRWRAGCGDRTSMRPGRPGTRRCPLGSTRAGSRPSTR